MGKGNDFDEFMEFKLSGKPSESQEPSPGRRSRKTKGTGGSMTFWLVQGAAAILLRALVSN